MNTYIVIGHAVRIHNDIRPDCLKRLVCLAWLIFCLFGMVDIRISLLDMVCRFDRCWHDDIGIYRRKIVTIF
jgi:hypothetical protein